MTSTALKTDITDEARQAVRVLRSIAVRALERMYLRDEKMFPFRVRMDGDSIVTEGLSIRYTAIALIGLAAEGQDVADTVLAGDSINDVCGRMVREACACDDAGGVALALWAARMLDHDDAGSLLEVLKRMDVCSGRYPTVETAWALTSLLCRGEGMLDEPLAAGLARLLMKTYNPRSGLFSHRPAGHRGSFVRAHVSCYADLVYPIQSLSHYYGVAGDEQAKDIACSCARHMCDLQGSAGQWWWHYDYRTGRVLEKYPVYAIHQDAMGPMALRAVQELCGQRHPDALSKSVTWLTNGPECQDALVDTERSVIWRKVARSDPSKLARTMQAAVSSIHPGLRMPAVDSIWPAGTIDYESRPYHMGWLLYAWSGTDALASCDTMSSAEGVIE